MKEILAKKSIATLIYTGVWLALVVLQTVVLSSNGTNTSVWQAPSSYYSTWIVDLYLILLFYTNYYLFAPWMIRRRLFSSYIALMGFFVLLAFLIPIILYNLFQWGMPGIPSGEVPYSYWGVLGSVASIAIGISVRSIIEWITLEQTLRNIQLENRNQSQLTEEISNLQRELEQTQSQLELTRSELLVTQQEVQKSGSPSTSGNISEA